MTIAGYIIPTIYLNILAYYYTPSYYIKIEDGKGIVKAVLELQKIGTQASEEDLCEINEETSESKIDIINTECVGDEDEYLENRHTGN